MKQFFSDEETKQQEQNKTASDNGGIAKEDESVGFATEEQAANNVKIFDEIAEKVDQLAIDSGNAKRNAAIFIGFTAVYAGKGKMEGSETAKLSGSIFSISEAILNTMGKNENFAKAVMNAVRDFVLMD